MGNPRTSSFFAYLNPVPLNLSVIPLTELIVDSTSFFVPLNSNNSVGFSGNLTSELRLTDLMHTSSITLLIIHRYYDRTYFQRTHELNFAYSDTIAHHVNDGVTCVFQRIKVAYSYSFVLGNILQLQCRFDNDTEGT